MVQPLREMCVCPQRCMQQPQLYTFQSLLNPQWRPAPCPQQPSRLVERSGSKAVCVVTRHLCMLRRISIAVCILRSCQKDVLVRVRDFSRSGVGFTSARQWDCVKQGDASTHSFPHRRSADAIKPTIGQVAACSFDDYCAPC
jgi:hypothetical protein